MRRLARLLTFILCFQVDITVKASHPSASEGGAKSENELLQDPPDCLHEVGECLFTTYQNRVAQVKVGSMTVGLSAGAVVKTKNPQRLRLLKGYIVVHSAADGVEVETLYGQLKLGREELVLVEINYDRVWVHSLKGNLKFNLPGTQDVAVVPEGFAFWNNSYILSSGEELRM